MSVSVTQPVEPAFERMADVLFRPFEVGKWFVLGFCAFLANLDQGGANFNVGGNWGGQGGGGGAGGGDFSQLTDWVGANVGLTVLIVLGVVLLGLGLTALLQWLASRGKFMFLDGVVHNRGAVVDPWKRFKVPANSFFLLRFAFTVVAGVTVLCVLLIGLLLAMPDIRAEQFGAGLIGAIVLGVVVVLPMAILFGFVQAVLVDFIVPVMYCRNMKVGQAVETFWEELLKPHLGTFVLFYLFKTVLAVAAAMVGFLAVCFTCCLVAIPYLGTVILLPVSVFFRSYSVYFLGQFGPDWQLIDQPPSDEAPSGGQEAVEEPSQKTSQGGDSYRGDEPWVSGD